MDNNKSTTEGILKTVANNWDCLSKEDQDTLIELFVNHSAEEIVFNWNRIFKRGQNENKIN